MTAIADIRPGTVAPQTVTAGTPIIYNRFPATVLAVEPVEDPFGEIEGLVRVRVRIEPTGMSGWLHFGPSSLPLVLDPERGAA